MKKRIVAIFAIIAMIMAYTNISMAATVEEYEEQKQNATNQKNNAQNELNEVNDKKNKANEELDNIKAQIGSLEAEISGLENKINNLNNSISAKENEIKQKEKELEEKQEILDKRLVVMYKTGGTSYLDVLLGSSNYIEMLSKLNVVNRIAEKDTELINKVKNEKQEIEKYKQSLENNKKEVEASKAELDAKNVALTSAKNSKQSVVNNLSAEAKALEKKIEEFQVAINNAQKEIERQTQQNIENNGKFEGSFEGTLSWPVSSSSYGHNIITSVFGRRPAPTAGASTNHGAVDIGVSYVPVLAPAAGKVILASYVSGYGNYIMIDHGNGYYTAFGHLSGYNVSVGSVVSRGQKIATSGNTGVSTGPHLHYEVYRGGRTKGYRVDPLQYTSHGTLYYT